MKRGSALLIVLGMIAFMVISAVAFSALMRHSRLPSSYLRRTSASRHLVKAALAEAIDLVDISLGNDPFPGIGDNAVRGWGSPRDPVNGQTQTVAKRNHWRGHVFIGTNQLCSADETVSTLAFEGLAYLPPALINEARYYSRRSVAGRWRNLGFDAGRYAFCAIDVSDHLDINRVFADRGRNSSDSGRVTLAHVFENANHTGDGNPSAADWDEFIVKFNDAVDASAGQPGANKGSGKKLPLVSLADMNLAINKEQPGWVETMSPFCRFLRNGTSFVTGMSGEDNERIRQMAFVTDSYTPSTNNSNSVKYDLCYAQPFRNSKMHGKNQQMSYMDQMGENTDILERLYDKVTTLDTVSLCDYLDENDIPTSLALPSVERVPMVCAVMPSVAFTLEPQNAVETPDAEARKQQANAANAPETIDVICAYKLKFSNPVGQVQAKLMYPFRSKDMKEESRNFDVDFALRIGFSDGDGPGLHQASGGYVLEQGDFDAIRDKADVRGGVIRVHATGSGDVKAKDVTGETSANLFSTVTATINLSDLTGWFNNNDLITTKWKYVKKQVGGTAEKPVYDYVKPDGGQPEEVKINADFHPLTAAGGDASAAAQSAIKSGGSVDLRPYMTVAVRVKSSKSQKYVDLVPASYLDDQIYNGLNTPPDVKAVCGNGHALLTVGDPASAANPFKFGETTWKGSFMQNLSPTANGGVLICPDPRWNFAPENFYVRDVSALPANAEFITLCDFEKDGRDCDPFLMVSDQGYMQSPSEFAFLPRTTTARLPIAGSMWGSCALTEKSGFETGSGAVAPYAKLAHGNLMWKTYRLFPLDGEEDDNIYDFGITSSGRGFRVDPFTSSRDVMMAALANTPVSWWAASTNLTANANLADLDANTFNRQYAFSEMNSKAKIAWKDLQKVADRFLAIFRRNDGNWQRAFHEQDWDGENNDLCGVDLDSTDVDTVLKDVDRKMLYGFWRDSFAQKQQLFLVFVRAEPMMMGGGAIGQTPPQLGARAVALVWRDPNPTRTDVGNSQPRPHRTRILFYRQFD